MKVPVLSSLILFHARQAGVGYHSLLPSGGGPRTHTGLDLDVFRKVCFWFRRSRVSGEIRKFNTPPPQVVRNRGWCVVVPGRPPSASVATDEQSLVTVDEAPQPRSRRPSLLPLRRQPRRDTKRPARYT